MQVHLSKKLLSVLTVTILIVMAPFVAMRYELIKNELRTQLHQEVEQIASRVAEAVKPSVWNEYIRPEEVTFSADVTRSIIQAELSSQSIVGIAVSDAFNQQFLGGYKLEDDTLISLPSPQTMPISQGSQETYSFPIHYKGVKIGKVDVIYRTEQIQSALSQSLSIEVIQLSVISLLILALLYAGLRHALLRPIQSLEIAHQAINSLSEAVIVTDPHFRITDVNRVYEQISGTENKQLQYRKPTFLIDQDGEQRSLWDVLPRAIHHWAGEIQVVNGEEKQIPAWLQLNEVIHNNRLVCYVGIVNDISEKLQAEHELHQMAYYDALTNLPNRTHFMETLNHEIMLAQRTQRKLGLLFIDLDNFKWINDNYGHGVGDQFLLSIANRFSERLRKTDFMFRLSGDEFTAIATDVQEEQHLEVLANELIQIASSEVILEGKKVVAGASIGVAIFPRDGKNLEELIQHADAAMYEAKEAGRNQAHFFSKELEQQRRNHREVQTELAHAIRHDQLVLYFQPKLRHEARRGPLFTSGQAIQNSQADGAEALIRWQHPEKGLLEPSQFIRIAEQSDLIIDMGYWVIKAACAQLANWKKTPLDKLSLAVNLSPRQLRHPLLVSTISRYLNEYGIDPQQLELEITESAIIENIEQSLSTLNQLKSLGVTLAMDDFGTGFSSLSYLKLLPIDVIKIDRSFIAGLPYDQDDAIIVRAIFSMAKAMDLKVVAEGIENPLQEQYLLQQGCLHSQGYYYSKPLSPEEFFSWVKQSQKTEGDLEQQDSEP